MGDYRVLETGHYLGRAVSRLRAPGFHLNLSSYRAHQRLDQHAHRNAHFCMVLQGAYRERLDGSWVDRAPADLIFYPPETGHAEWHLTAGRHFLVEIEPELLSRFVDSGQSFDGIRSVSAGPPATTAARIYREFCLQDPCSPLAMETLVLEFLAACARGSEALAARHDPPWLDRAEELLRDGFVEPPALAEIAAEVGVHPVYLARRFRRRFGCTPGEYVRSVRFEFASRELARSDRPLAEVAQEAGFFDQSHFTRLFKRKAGMTPGQYRRLFRG